MYLMFKKTRGNVLPWVFLCLLLVQFFWLSACVSEPASKLVSDRKHAYKSSLITFSADGLKQYSLVLTPDSQVPGKGFPVVIFGHGFHPEPKKYGISSTGKVSRPGDYYRGVPESYAARGFLVFAPDYRGHNKSEGYEFTQLGIESSDFYAEDVLQLLKVVLQNSNIDSDRIYYVGHSMGANVGLRLLAQTNKIRAASLWSAATDVVAQRVNTPLIIHHARGDATAPFAWSEKLVEGLKLSGNTVQFYAYGSDNHLFEDENFNQAVERDLRFFNEY